MSATTKPETLRFRADQDASSGEVDPLQLAIPTHWQLLKLKYVADVRCSSVDKHSLEGETPVRLCNYVDVYKNERITGALEFMTATASDEEIRRFTLAEGDVLITKDSESWNDIGVPALVTEPLEGVLCGYHLALIRPNGTLLSGGFLTYVFAARGIADQLYVRANGVTRFGMSASAIGGMMVPIPPMHEQEALVAFIGSRTAKLDALIARKTEFLARLEEERTSTISTLVLRGTEGDVTRTPSGIETVGSIPSHWQVFPLMRLTPDQRPIMYGIVLPGPNVPGGIPIVKGGDVAPGRLTLDSLSRTTPDIEAAYARARLKPGDLVYAIRGSIGAVEEVPEELDGANLTQDVARVSPRPEVNRRWLLYALRARPVFAQLDARATGATIRGINIRDLKRVRVPVPPREEQDRIAQALDRETARIDALVERIRNGIERLREYRTAMITAAVSGRIDVRGEAAA